MRVLTLWGAIAVSTLADAAEGARCTPTGSAFSLVLLNLPLLLLIPLVVWLYKHMTRSVGQVSEALELSRSMDEHGRRMETKIDKLIELLESRLPPGGGA